MSDVRGAPPTVASLPQLKVGSDAPFFLSMGSIGGSYILLILVMLAADLKFTSLSHFQEALEKPEIQFAIKLTLATCTISALLSLLVAVPLGYLMSRFNFRGRWFIDTVLDVPIVLPPLVIGLSLLILFHVPLYDVMVEEMERGPNGTMEKVERIRSMNLEAVFEDFLKVRIAYAQPAVVLAQFAVACAFAVQTMRVTFEQIDPRAEQVALTLGCRRSQAFFLVTFPQAWRGMIAAGTVAWARSLGEFGPILVFAGATRMKTEVLSTTVFLELSVGKLEAAVAVSLLMVAAAMAVLGIVRIVGARTTA